MLNYDFFKNGRKGNVSVSETKDLLALKALTGLNTLHEFSRTYIPI